MPKKNLINQRFGKLTVLSEAEKIVYKNGTAIQWNCQCDCGNTKKVRTSNLTSGNTTSCGCVHKAAVSNDTTHGLTRRGKVAPEYWIWRSMKQRCLDKSNIAYENYGGRGITICNEWLDFETFYKQMGPRPSKNHSINRIDNNAGYCPGNCEWASRETQMHNTRTNVFTEELVKQAREMYSNNYTTSEIAKALGTTYAATYAVVKNKSWKTID